MEHFTTDGLRNPDAFAQWHEYVCKTYVPLDLSTNFEPRFTASASAVQVGRSLLTSVTSSAAEYTRTRKNIRTSDHGDYLLTTILSGEMRIEQDNRMACIGSGDLCLFDTSRPYHLAVSDNYSAIHIQTIRDEFDRRFPFAEKVTAMRVAAQGRYARLASTVLQSTLEAVGDSSPRLLGPAIIDMVALAFDESFNDIVVDPSRYGKIVSRAQEVMFDHLFDPSFDISSVPNAVGVSPRTLSRAFAHMGLTPSKWVWSKRLDAAREMILASHTRSVSEVAITCGFNDFSHFSRAFKLQFGVSPSAAKRSVVSVR